LAQKSEVFTSDEMAQRVPINFYAFLKYKTRHHLMHVLNIKPDISFLYTIEGEFGDEMQKMSTVPE